MGNEINAELHRKKIVARFKELSVRASKLGRYCYTDFLSISDKVYLKEAGINGNDSAIVDTFGGAQYCDRVIFRFGNSMDIGYEEEYPIRIIQVIPKTSNFRQIEHRDILGTVMGLGLERSKIGDIKLSQNEAYIFALENIADYIIQNVTQINKMPVSCNIVDEVSEEIINSFTDMDCVAASLRVDCIAGTLTKKSRTASVDLIKEKKFMVNGIIPLKTSSLIKDGDIIVIRGYGKFMYDGVSGNTGNGNLHLKFRKFN